MKKNQNDATHNIALGTAIIIVALVIIFGAVFYWMWSMDMLFLPSFIEDIFGITGEDDEPSWDLGALSALVKDGKDEAGDTVTLDVSYENLKEAFLNRQSEDGVYLDAYVTYFASGQEFQRKIVYSRDGERFRMEKYYVEPSKGGGEEQTETLKISDGETLYVLDYASGEERYLTMPDSISPENEAGIPSVDTLIEVLGQFPESAGDSGDSADITDTTLKLMRTDRGNVYYIAYTYADIGLTEEYFVSLDHRMIIFAESTQNGKKVYSYTTTSFSTDSKDYSNDELYNISKPD